MSNRVEKLRRERDRISAEINAIESGILPLAERRGALTSAYLADVMGYPLPNASQQLQRLYKAGVLDRRRKNPAHGGRGYEYFVKVAVHG